MGSIPTFGSVSLNSVHRCLRTPMYIYEHQETMYQILSLAHVPLHDLCTNSCGARTSGTGVAPYQNVLQKHGFREYYSYSIRAIGMPWFSSPRLDL